MLLAPCAESATSYAEAELAGATLRIDFTRPIDASRAAELSGWLRDVAASVAEVSGRFPVPDVRVRIIESTRGDGTPISFGRVSRTDGLVVDLFVDPDRPVAEFYGDWEATHEFSHLLLPRIDVRQRWISEGFASYYQNVLMARAGHYEPLEAIDKLAQGFERGRASSPALSPNEAALAGLRRARYKIYWSGAAIALLADVELRQRSGDAESLDVVLDRFQRCCLPSGRRWSGRALFQQFDRLIEEPVFMPLYRRYADSPGFPDFEDALNNDIVEEKIFAVRTSTN
ncbi:MAG: hypothetical protein HKN65_04715 [Woeseiaceae bacterium]|nr:hypothetical protein [Woeseiaceae bacterium]